MSAADRAGEGPAPDVSVVVPTYDRRPYLEEAIASLRAQTCDRWEAIVIDDGSRDGTAAWLRSLGDARIRVLERLHDGNVARLRNAGVHAARGRWIAFLDSDDRWAPGKLAAQLAAVAGQAGCRWGYTASRVIDADGAPVDDTWLAPARPHSGWILPALLVHEARTVPSAVLVERALVLEAGGFDETLPWVEDYDLWLRLARAAPACALPEPLCEFRRHARNNTRGQAAIEGTMVRVYAKCARAVADPRLRRLCRAQEGVFRVRWANQLAAEGRTRAGLAALLGALPARGASRGWWATLAKALLRPLVPARMRARLRRPQPWRA